ncbi:LysR family transcriptional regulator [Saccharospirillum salsuginis]|uniref:LysR family transcriptional regulator n=1 Tax=Saccharospirillum salsuginis TaxID=418750 RepID=A0A918KS94_9GAMM|nr:LysR family transcriptional regulator [Saccharospirillum salsuginis]GGX75091.1 LysR family transcriptional regulator [Saccharospirillum salsuginis]
MLDAMEQFVKIVDLGSFSAAATVLGKNPSTLTRRLDHLEHELGTTLLVRSTRRLDLTPDGEHFYHQALGILSSVEDVKGAFQKTPQPVSGLISITTFDTFGRETLVPLLARFRDRYPDTRIALSLANQVIDLYNSPYDIAVRYGRPEDSSLIYRPLQDMSAVVVASPQYIERHASVNTPEDLQNHTCLAFLKPRQFTWWYFRKDKDARKIRINPVMASEGGTPLLMWARAHQGITMVSRSFIEDDLANGRLVELLPDWQASLTEHNASKIYLTWKAASSKNPAVRALVDFLVDELGT